MATARQSNPSPDDVWQMFQETDRRFKETALRFKETDRKFQETDRKFQETNRQFKETALRFKETDRQIGKLGNRLGDFVEWSVLPAAVRLFRARGIEVHEVMRHVSVQRGDEGLELDLLASNDVEAVAIECKSSLSPEDVNVHLARLGRIKRLLPRLAAMRVYGAVAAIALPDEVAGYAYRQGLFVIAQSGDQLIIRNDPRFQPRAW